MKKLITLIMFFTAVVYSQTTDNEDVNDKDIEEVVVKGMFYIQIKLLL